MPGLTPQQALEKLTWKGAAAQASSAQASSAVRVAVDTKHHLIITHEVTNVRTDRSPAWPSGRTFRAYRAAC